MEGFCTWADSCEDSTNKTPLIFLLVILISLTTVLFGLLAREQFLKRKTETIVNEDSMSNARLINERILNQQPSRHGSSPIPAEASSSISVEEVKEAK